MFLIFIILIQWTHMIFSLLVNLFIIKPISELFSKDNLPKVKKTNGYNMYKKKDKTCGILVQSINKIINV